MTGEEDDGLRVRAALIGAGVALVLSYMLLRFLADGGHALPQQSWMTLAVLGVVGAAVLSLAWSIRSYVKGDTREPPSPQLGRGVLVAARSCAIAGAVIAGFYAAEVLVRLPNAEIPSQQSAMWLGLTLTLGSALLSAAGYVAQSWCRIPPEDEDHEHDDGAAAL